MSLVEETEDISEETVEKIKSLQLRFDDAQLLNSLYLSRLQEINIDGKEGGGSVRFDDPMVDKLVNAIIETPDITKTLQRLILKNHRITRTDTIVNNLMLNKDDGGLVVLDLTSNDIDYNGILPVIESLADFSSKLETLKLSMNPIGTETAIRLSEVVQGSTKISKLRHLWVASCDFELKAIVALTTSLDRTLEAIVLDRPLLTTSQEEGTDHFSRMLSAHSTLSEVSLKYHKIEDKGATLIAQSLGMNQSLVYLNLDCNRIGVGGAEALASYLIKYNRLETLYMSYNMIGDEGAKAMGKALEKNSSLLDLALGTNKIGPIGVAAIAKSMTGNQGRLKYLSLFGNDFDDASCREWKQQIDERLNYLDVFVDIKIYVVDGIHKVANNSGDTF